VSAVIADPPPAWHGHDVRVELPDELPLIDADLVLMSRVLTNLVDNAVRHSPAGAPVLVRAAAMPPGVIELSVTDQGPGVEPGRRDEIFGLFARRDDDAGAGLGLTIAKTFVEAHGQRIWVEDAPGGGARFCFTLPVVPPIAEEPQLAASSHHR
jgi:two-component system, OmpR family, sensor histidine kinase KdpD